jgi:hypothetical protein
MPLIVRAGEPYYRQPAARTTLPSSSFPCLPSSACYTQLVMILLIVTGSCRWYPARVLALAGRFQNTVFSVLSLSAGLRTTGVVGLQRCTRVPDCMRAAACAAHLPWARPPHPCISLTLNLCSDCCWALERQPGSFLSSSAMHSLPAAAAACQVVGARSACRASRWAA